VLLRGDLPKPHICGKSTGSPKAHEGITAYANSALQKHGYIYKFHSCDFIESKKLESLNPGHDPAIHSVYSLPLDLARGGRRAFKIHVEDVGPCSNCFALIPALSFSAQSVLAVLDGKKYLLKRPVEFRPWKSCALNMFLH
jgi:hypothetical protein